MEFTPMLFCRKLGSNPGVAATDFFTFGFEHVELGAMGNAQPTATGSASGTRQNGASGSIGFGASFNSGTETRFGGVPTPPTAEDVAPAAAALAGTPVALAAPALVEGMGAEPVIGLASRGEEQEEQDIIKEGKQRLPKV
jgi:hypothetical protein